MKTVMYGRGFWVITACLLLILPVSVQAQMKGPPVPFSADWAIYDESDDEDDYDDYDDYDDDGEASDWITGRYLKGRYFASADGVRVQDTVDGQPFLEIYNVPRMVVWSYYLSESRREYIEEAIDADDFHFIGLGWVGRPCPADARATHSGSETLDGRKTEIWTCASRELGTVKVWYDPHLQAILRTEDEFGYGELTNIREGRQPASLFVLPPGYSKMDIPEFEMRESPFGGW